VEKRRSHIPRAVDNNRRLPQTYASILCSFLRRTPVTADRNRPRLATATIMWRARGPVAGPRFGQKLNCRSSRSRILYAAEKARRSRPAIADVRILICRR
jgi:hypothetical protein